MLSTGSNRLHVRSFQPNDLPQLLDFLRAQYPASPHKSDARRFQHRFAEHPCGSALDRFMLAFEGDRIVGQLAALRDRVHSQGSWHEAFWLVDLMVAPEHRGGLAALRLFQSQMATDALLLSTGAGPHLESLYAALGWRRRAICQSCYLAIRPTRLMQLAAGTGRVSRRPLLAPALWAADRTLPWVHRWHAGLQSRDIVIEPLHAFDVDFERFATQLLPSLGNTCWRGAETLNWRFNLGPRSATFALAAREREGGALRGYVVAKRLRRGEAATWIEVVDYLVAPTDVEVFVSLTCAVVRQSLALRADFVRWRLSCDSHLSQLRSPWWLRRTEPIADEVFMHSRNSDLLAALAEEPWHLTSLASDRAEGGSDAPWDQELGVFAG